jgi:hypothetical protein
VQASGGSKRGKESSPNSNAKPHSPAIRSSSDSELEKLLDKHPEAKKKAQEDYEFYFVKPFRYVETIILIGESFYESDGEEFLTLVDLTDFD